MESTPTTPVMWPPPCRGTFMVPTVTALLEWRIRRTVQGTDRYRNLTVSERVCVICLGYLERIDL